jgi:hypothetical protein
MNFVECWFNLYPDGGNGTVEIFLFSCLVIVVAIFVAKLLKILS